MTIVDDEIIWELTPVVIDESTGGAINVPLLETLGPPSGDVTFTITGHGTRLVPNPTKLTFPVDSWQSSQRLYLIASPDNDDRDDRVNLTLTAAGGGYGGLTYSLEVLIRDTPPFKELSIREGDSVTLHGIAIFSDESPPQHDLISTFSGFNGTDLTVYPVTVTHTVESWTWVILCIDGSGMLWFHCSPGEDVTITAGHDEDEEDDQVILIYEITGPAHENRFLGLTGQIGVRIVDDDGPGLEVSRSSLSIPEGDKRSFSVRLDEAPPGDLGNNNVTVHIPQRRGDLTASPVSLTFTKADWDQWQDVELTAGHDADIVDDMEEFTVTASGIGFDRARESVSVTILDDEEPALRIYPWRVNVIEGGDWVVVWVALAATAPPTGEVTVVVPQFTDPALQHNRHRPMYFTPSDYKQVQAILIWGEEDADAVNESETLTLTASGGGYNGVTRPIVVSVSDNDVAGARLEVDPISVSVDEGSTAEFTVRLSTEPEGTVTVRVPPFTDPALHQHPSTLTFTRSDYLTAQAVTVLAAEDANTVNESESIRLTASGGGYSAATQAVTVTVIDNDIAKIELIPSSLSMEEGTAETYSVRLLAEPVEPVTINIVESGGSVTVSPLTLHFTASNWDESQRVTVRADRDDNAINETSTLIHTAVSMDPGFSGTTAALPVTVIDLDVPRLEVTPIALTIDEGSSAEFTVKLMSEPTADVTVQIADFTNPDLTHNQSALTFTPSTWDAPQTVIVSAAEDANAVDESDSITLTASGGGSDGLTQTVTVTVIDNDIPGIELVPSSLNVTEGTAETYAVRLLSEPSEPVTLHIVESGGIVTVSPLALHFAASNWDESQQVSVQADLDDNSMNETSSLIHTATSVDRDYSGTTVILPVTVIDRDVPHLVITPGALTMDEGTSAEFTVKLASEPTIPVAVEISTFTNPDLTHDQPTLAFTLIDLGHAAGGHGICHSG